MSNYLFLSILLIFLFWLKWCRCQKKKYPITETFNRLHPFTEKEKRKTKVDWKNLMKAREAWPRVEGHPILPADNKEKTMSVSVNKIALMSDKEKEELMEYILFTYGENTYEQIAQKFGIENPKQVVQLATQMRKYGLLVPRTRHSKGSSYIVDFIEKMKKSHPELVKADPAKGSKWRE